MGSDTVQITLDTVKEKHKNGSFFFAVSSNLFPPPHPFSLYPLISQCLVFSYFPFFIVFIIPVICSEGDR